MSQGTLSFDHRSLAAAYARGECTPHDVVDEVFARIERDRERIRNVWLHLFPRDAVHAAVDRVIAARESGRQMPLFGLPFAVKDSIDVAGAPTTVACPAYAYLPERSAPVVDRLVEGGAIAIGKVNLDQFATGLVGVRSPYGVPTNPFDPAVIPGGSSSGSAVAVAAGQVAFALGTDTAGSGRVPAALNNVVGFKPSCGLLSARGVVPACRSIDCVTVFALTVPDACAVAACARGWDPEDPFSRPEADDASFSPSPQSRPWRIGVPSARDLEFYGDEAARSVFVQAVARTRDMSCVVQEIDLRPFLRAGELLYGGPWVAERLVAAGSLLDRDPEALLPVTREILQEARRFGVLDVFEANYRLRALRQAIEPTWAAIDALLVPTTPTVYRVEEVRASPRELNSRLGRYTTFTNLLDLAAVAVPAGFRADGVPSGITFIGPRGRDSVLAAIAELAHQAAGVPMGATGHALPPSLAARSAPAESSTEPSAPSASSSERDALLLVVVGAHLSGLPLNHQLTERGARLVGAAKTAPRYRLFALPSTTPPKPGLVHVREDGVPIDVEIWSLDERAFGSFVASIVRPMCIGSVEIDDGRSLSGFLCEPEALTGAVDISRFGGWRAYVAQNR